MARTYYCPAGGNRQLINAATEYTTPKNAPVGFRTGKASCSTNEYCEYGKALKRISWDVASTIEESSWASCNTDAGAAVTLTFAEGNDRNGDNVPGDFTEIAIKSSTPVAGGILLFSIVGGAHQCRQAWGNDPTSYPGPGQFEISSLNKLVLKASVRTANPPGLNFEDCVPPDGYSVLVRATVGSYSQDCKVLIKVGDVNEKPFIDQGQIFTVPENSEPTVSCTGGPVTAQDSEVDNGDQALTWAILSGCNDQNGNDLSTQCPLVIGICDGQIRVTTQQYLNAAALDYESTTWRNEYTLLIKANDDGPAGGQKDELTVIVRITDVNEAPAILGSDNGGSFFQVNEHAITTEAVENNGGVTIDTCGPQACMIIATDIDVLGGHDTTLTYIHHTAGQVPFAVSSVGAVTVDLTNAANTGDINFEAPQKLHALRISVEDSGWGTNPSNPLPSPETVTITVQIIDQNDNPIINPVWSHTGTTVDLFTGNVLSFAEDCFGKDTSADGTSCTHQLTASDPDDINTGTSFGSISDGWTLDDNCGNLFAITPQGVLSVAVQIPSDGYESAVTTGNEPYYCTVTAKIVDNGGKFDSMSIAVKFTDVNETPTLVVNVAACEIREDADLNEVTCSIKI